MSKLLALYRQLTERLRTNPLWATTVDLSALQAVGYLIPLVSMPYLIRVLGTANYGTLVLVLAIAGYFGALADFGFGYSAVRTVASERHDGARLGTACSAILLGKTIPAGLAWLTLWVAARCLSLPADMAGPLRMASLLIPLGALNPSWYFQGVQQLRRFVLGQIIVRLAGLGLLFSIVRSSHALEAAVLVELSIALGVAVTGWILIHTTKPIGLRRPPLAAVKRALRDAANFFGSTLAAQLYTSSLILVLGIFATREQVAYFSIAERIGSAIRRLFQPLLQALIPHVNQMRRRDHDSTITFLNAIYRRTFIGGLFITIIIVAFAPIGVPIIAGKASPMAVYTLWALSPQAWLIALSNVLGVQALFAFDIVKPVVRIQWVVGVATIVVAVFCAHAFGSIGVAISGTLAEAIVTAALLRICQRELAFPKPGFRSL